MGCERQALRGRRDPPRTPVSRDPRHRARRPHRARDSVRSARRDLSPDVVARRPPHRVLGDRRRRQRSLRLRSRCSGDSDARDTPSRRAAGTAEADERRLRRSAAGVVARWQDDRVRDRSLHHQSEDARIQGVSACDDRRRDARDARAAGGAADWPARGEAHRAAVVGRWRVAVLPVRRERHHEHLSPDARERRDRAAHRHRDRRHRPHAPEPVAVGRGGDRPHRVQCVPRGANTVSTRSTRA